ncbi:MAG: cytochrome c oxidase subunit 3 [Candidatus Kapabacteria bacterium]|nr:cytochrome c oxidase subunit 3 [Candidatus Kapabacteria bacterium]
MPTGQLFVWFLIVGITMFFAALVSAAIVRIGIDGRSLALPGIVWGNTVSLLLSSAALGVAQLHMHRRSGVDETAMRFLWVALCLGLVFVGGQIVAWVELVQRGIFLPSFPAASFFYILTAAHGLHLLGGILALLGLVGVRRRSLLFRRRLAPVAMYWHFLTLIWLALLWVLQSR